MKKILPLLLAICLLGGVVGCSQTNDDSPASGTATTEDNNTTPDDNDTTPADNGGGTAGLQASDLKIAVLIPGSETDGGFCQLGAEAVRFAGDAVGVQTVSVIEAQASDVKNEVESLVDEGYHIIFGHGGEYANPFQEVSGDYPDVLFPTMGGNVVTENQMPMSLNFEEICFVMGAMAATISETGTIGMSVGGDFPAYTKTTVAMELGAQYINPDIKTLYAVLSHADMNEAYETVLNQINSGADVIFCNADAGTVGSYKAVTESDVYTFGVLADYTETAPDNVLINGLCNYGMAYKAMIDNYLAGTIKPEIMFLGLAEGAIDFTWNEGLKSSLPQEVQDIPDQLIPLIISGEIHVPNEYELDN